MSKVVLLIAFDFPPCQSPGVERTLKFAKYLKNFGWQPIVLTVNENTHTTICNDVTEILDGILIYRSFCLDVSRHLAFRGKYFGWMKQPDRYWGWIFTAIPLGLKIIKKHHVNVIWSTFPLLTSHIIGMGLKMITGIPWVADYRDPLQSYYDKKVYNKEKFARWLDRQIAKKSNKIVMATNGMVNLYRTIHNSENSNKFVCIENGFDSEKIKNINFDQLDNTKLHIYHGGSLYETGRNPCILFKALEKLKQQGLINKGNIAVEFQGENNQSVYQPLTEDLGISDIVKFSGKVSYVEALNKMSNANLLLIIQGDIFNNQIPSKAYEYLAMPRPILALTPKHSETALLLKEEPLTLSSENIDDVVQFISEQLTNILDNNQRCPVYIERKCKTMQLVEQFELLIKQI